MLLTGVAVYSEELGQNVDPKEYPACDLDRGGTKRSTIIE